MCKKKQNKVTENEELGKEVKEGKRKMKLGKEGK